ncbi:MAG: dihydropteroate synthase [Pseudobdellovibrionaceae bacterium]
MFTPERQPILMGILNVTPDSFSDGGQFATLDQALAQATKLHLDGATIIDVGGESTRPGAAAVSVSEELERVIPVIEGIRKLKLPVTVSVDTSKFEVAEKAVAAGATIINDVTGGTDTRLPKLLIDSNATIIAMHMQGTPRSMQENPVYPDGVVAAVSRFLSQRVRAFREFGVTADRIWVDPGIGFGKTVHHNLDLLRHLTTFARIGGKLVVGTSRKSFLAHLVHDNQMELRHEGTVASNLWATTQGAGVLRVHDVAAMKRALVTWSAIQDDSF